MVSISRSIRSVMSESVEGDCFGSLPIDKNEENSPNVSSVAASVESASMSHPCQLEVHSPSSKLLMSEVSGTEVDKP